MMYIHDSLKTDEFLKDKKLNLLKRGIITLGQFINLIDKNDPYTLIGPAIVAKNKINDFIIEWKSKVNTIKPIQEVLIPKITHEDIIKNLDALCSIFPEINDLVNEFKIKLKTTNCPVCQKNKYILAILGTIRPLYNDGRDLKELKNFIEALITKYYPMNNKIVTSENLQQFDINWVKPDNLIGLGNDLILGLSNCFNCCKKHLSRAKAFYEEWHQGYPNHSTLMYNEFTEANKDIEEGYVLFWDSLGQLDMASSELVGNLIDLESGWQAEIIELANKIRTQRILFQEDSTKVPNWNQLRVEVQKLQNKINKLKTNLSNS